MENQEKKVGGMALRNDAQIMSADSTVSSLHPGQYHVPLACFDCCKTTEVETQEKNSQCPDCGKPLHFMGRSFKAPISSNKDQWEKMRRLWHAGFRFTGFRSFAEAEPFPEKLSEVDGFITRNPNHPMRVKG